MNKRAPAGVLLLLTCCLAPAQADQATVALVNSIRARAPCADTSPAPALRASAALDEAARTLASDAGAGRRLNELLARSGYRASKSMVIQVTGGGSGPALGRYLERTFCDALLGREWAEMGVHQARDRGRTWIVLASPFSPPRAEDAAEMGARVLSLVNAARERDRACGDRPFRAAPPLRWSQKLADIGLQHSQDMAGHGYFSHAGRDGSDPAARATRGGYRWRSVGENIAAGPTTPEAVVQGWIDSPGHCANLMGTQFVEMGVAYAVNPASPMGIYWTQMFGAPR